MLVFIYIYIGGSGVLNKTIFGILSVILTSMLIVSGCSQQSNDQTKTASFFLDKRETIAEIDFSVPSAWKSRDTNNDNGTWYFPNEDNDTFLDVQYYNIREFPSNISDKYAMIEKTDEFLSDLVEDTGNFKEVSKTVYTFSDGTYYSIVDFMYSIDGEEYEILDCIFFTSTHTYSIMFGQPTKISKTFRVLYDEIIESLVINKVELKNELLILDDISN